jgi:anti-sigma factor RsiW
MIEGMVTPVAGGAEPGFTIQCRQVVELVTDYLEGVLDAATRLELEAHLAICPGCAEYVHQIQVTLRMVGEVPLESLSASFKAGLLAAFRDPSGQLHQRPLDYRGEGD